MFIYTKIDELIFEEIKPIVDVLRERVNEIKKKRLDHDIHICFADFKNKHSGISKATFRNYETMYSTINKCLKFSKKKTVNIDEIDYRFYTLFSSWMEKEHGLQPNSCRERVKRMKAFLKIKTDLCYCTWITKYSALWITFDGNLMIKFQIVFTQLRNFLYRFINQGCRRIPFGLQSGVICFIFTHNLIVLSKEQIYWAL